MTVGRDRHQIDIVELAAMETGLVKVTAESIARGLHESGQVVLEAIFFDTDKAIIKGESQPALEEIAKFLKAQEGNFFVVGHTDTTGTFDHNMTLSRARAAAVVEALGKGHGIAAGRLEAHGVGPVAPATGGWCWSSGSRRTDRERALQVGVRSREPRPTAQAEVSENSLRLLLAPLGVLAVGENDLQLEEVAEAFHAVDVNPRASEDKQVACLRDRAHHAEGEGQRLAQPRRIADRYDAKVALAQSRHVGPPVDDQLGRAGILLAQLQADPPVLRGREVHIGLVDGAPVRGADGKRPGVDRFGIVDPDLDLDVARHVLVGLPGRRGMGRERVR